MSDADRTRWATVKVRKTTPADWADVTDAIEDYAGLAIGADNLAQPCLVDGRGQPLCYTPREALRKLGEGNWERWK